MLELKRRGRTRVQTEMIEFITLPFPSSKAFRCRRRRSFVRSLIGSLSNNDGDGHKKCHLKREFARLLRQMLASVFGVEF